MTAIRWRLSRPVVAGFAAFVALAAILLLTGCGTDSETNEAAASDVAGEADGEGADTGDVPGAGGRDVGGADASDDVATVERGELTDYTAVVDVRTPAEYADGHVVDAENIDLQSPGFVEQIGTLPDSGITSSTAAAETARHRRLLSCARPG